MRISAYSAVLLSLVIVASVQAADDWTQQFPSSHPSGRRDFGMAYAGGEQVLLFGGFVGSNINDETWVYDLGEGMWFQQYPSSKPSARDRHAMAHIGGDRVLLFGGYDVNGRDDETWLYDLSDGTWTQQLPSSSPSARRSHRMAYIGGDQVLLFGGKDASGFDDETWVYDLSGNTWTEQFPSAKPSARESHAMAYIGGGHVLLFGGYDYAYLDETWVYDVSGSTWTQQSPSSCPSARCCHAMAYIGEDRLLLSAGWRGYNLNDTWSYYLSDDAWTQDLNTVDPSARSCHALAEASVDGSNYLVMFGGQVYPAGDYLDDTWTFGGGDYFVPDPPEVAVTYPNGGEVVAGSVNIMWTATDPDPGETALLLIDLDYSDDAGATWSLIAFDEDNGGSYVWDVSGLPPAGDSCLLRIVATDTTGLSDADTSDAVFSLNDARPTIVAVDDVPNDQGREVAVLWQRSYLDDAAYQVITYYSIWRLYPYGEGIMSLYREWDVSAPDGLGQVVCRVFPTFGGERDGYWELIGTTPADFLTQYAYRAPTLEDSSSSGAPYFSYLVSAHTEDPYVFYDSTPDSGYSVDNTTPRGTTVAIQFQGGAAPGTVRLTWDEVTMGINGLPELIPVGYRIYRSMDPRFMNPPGALVTTTYGLSFDHTDPSIGDPGANLYYVITAIDGSDNESTVSNVVGEFDRELP